MCFILDAPTQYDLHNGSLIDVILHFSQNGIFVLQGEEKKDRHFLAPQTKEQVWSSSDKICCCCDERFLQLDT